MIRWPFITAFALASAAALADEIVVDDHGRQVHLADDGTWTTVTADRFATNRSGERIRLRPDGTWTRVRPDAATPDGGPVSVRLAGVEILKKKRLARQKAQHAETRIVFALRVANGSARTVALADDLAGRLTASSSSGEVYPIVAVSGSPREIGPGATGNLDVVGQGSPQWFGIESVSLEIPPGALGNTSRIVLTRSLDEVERTEVRRLP